MKKRPDLRIKTFEKFDGSVWRQYESEGYRVLLTGAGRRLLTSRHMSRALQPYIDDYLHQREGVTDSRRFFADGGNSRLFSLSDDLLVKESKRQSRSSLFAALERMDRLVDAVQKHCPRWIDVPVHYGAVISRSDITKQFMIVQKIDHGVTVGDIENDKVATRSSEGGLAVDALDRFGSVGPELKEEVLERFQSLRGWLEKAVVEEGLDPTIYIPDLGFLPDQPMNYYNVVLERQETPVAESPFKYWVIDQ